VAKGERPHNSVRPRLRATWKLPDFSRFTRFNNARFARLNYTTSAPGLSNLNFAPRQSLSAKSGMSDTSIISSPHAAQLDALGVDALVLFNRFYQPDIDIEELEVRRVNLSSPAELLLRLRWLAILSGRVRASLGATGGVHTAIDAVKAVMAGAHGVQMVAALLQRGPAYLAQVRDELARWLEEHDYESLEQMRGSMSLERCDDPRAYERANYVALLQSWHG